jgi:NAD(P)-dependent dehydrogenase (short-subunit alcohol dehydrogenase family)
VVNDIGRAVDGAGAFSDAAQDVVDEIIDRGGIAVANHGSVATQEGAAAIVAEAIAQFGRIDILINNAGILRDKAFHRMDALMINDVIDVHLKGALFVSQPAFVHMREQGFGRIVNTTSASGLFGNFGQANYGAAKAGLLGLTRVLSIEGAMHNVNVNAIAPIALTRMSRGLENDAASTEGAEGGRWTLGGLVSQASAEAVSPLVVYLSSDQCVVSGNVYSVAGGRISRIAVLESPGVVLDDNSPESIQGIISEVDGTDYANFAEPQSLDDEATIIVRSLDEHQSGRPFE